MSMQDNGNYYFCCSKDILYELIYNRHKFSYLWLHKLNFTIMKKIFLLLVVLNFSYCTAKVDIKKENDNHISSLLKKETIEFPSKDGLIITADTYFKNGNSKFVLLCHQAGFSRGEYIHTAPILVEKGFNAMAIDQRSGNKVNDIINETNKLATSQGKATDYVAAKQDIIAAIDKAYELNHKKPIYLVGSSYSASLVLLTAKDNPKVKAVAAFSPGEYLEGIEVTSALKGYEKNVFVTSSKKETASVESLVKFVDSKYLTHFKSMAKGIHGSRALWDSTDGHEAYWKAFDDFLSK